MNNLFQFRYPPYLVTWFSRVCDMVRAKSGKHSVSTRERLAETERMLKAGERMKESVVRQIAFSRREDEVDFKIRIALWNYGFSVHDSEESYREIHGKTEYGTKKWHEEFYDRHFSYRWDGGGVGVYRVFEWVDESKMEYDWERKVIDLRTYLDGIDVDWLVWCNISTWDSMCYKVFHGAAELEDAILSYCICGQRPRCKLMSRDGFTRVKLENGTVTNEATGEKCGYENLRDLLEAIPRERYDEGVRLYQ